MKYMWANRYFNMVVMVIPENRKNNDSFGVSVQLTLHCCEGLRMSRHYSDVRSQILMCESMWCL